MFSVAGSADTAGQQMKFRAAVGAPVDQIVFSQGLEQHPASRMSPGPQAGLCAQKYGKCGPLQPVLATWGMAKSTGVL